MRKSDFESKHTVIPIYLSTRDIDNRLFKKLKNKKYFKRLY